MGTFSRDFCVTGMGVDLRYNFINFNSGNFFFLQVIVTYIVSKILLAIHAFDKESRFIFKILN